MSPKLLRQLLFTTIVIACATRSQADFIVNITEVGSDVVATGSGSLNMTGFSVILPNVGTTQSEVGANNALLFIGDATPALLNVYFPIGITITGPSSLGTGDIFLANSGSGTRVGIIGPVGIQIDQGYISGSSLNSTATWTNQTIDSLGITPGTYTWSWGTGGTADSFTINAITGVPEPSSIILTSMAIASLFATQRFRRSC